MTHRASYIATGVVASVLGLAGSGSVACAQTIVVPPALPACKGFAEPAIRDEATFEPLIGQEHDVEVGGTLFASDMVTIAQAGIRLQKEASINGNYSGTDFVLTVPPAVVGPADVRNGTYRVSGSTFRYLREKSARDGLSSPEIGVFATDGGTVLRAAVNFGLKSKDYIIPDAHFEELRCVRVSPRALRTEILYAGAAKGVLTLQYREFQGGIARPAFQQDATFDLSEGNEIAFKGVRVKILKTSNVGARYVITSVRPQ